MAPADKRSAPTEWTLARVLASMGEQGRTGILEVASGSQATRIHMRRGQIVYAEHTSGTEAWPLGEYLLESGTVKAPALLEAREKAELMGVSLEEYLIDKKLVSEDVLKRFADLHVAEVLFPLFRRTKLSMNFLDERPHNPRLITALPVNFVLKEADRRAELWPELRRRVGGPRAVYGKDPSIMAEILGYVDAQPGDEEALPEMSASARVIFFHINGKKTVEQLARASGLGMFETYRALGELLDAMLLELIAHEGPGEQPAQRSPHLPRIISVLAWLALAGLLALGVQWWLSGGAGDVESTLMSDSPEVREVIGRSQVADIEAALELYQIRTGEYPERLEDLITRGYLSSDVARTFEALTYERQDRAHVLRVTAPP